MKVDKKREFTEINKIYIISMILYLLVFLLCKNILGGQLGEGCVYLISISLALLASYMPYFTANNFKYVSLDIQEENYLSKKEYFIFIIFMLFSNVVTYFFIEGVEATYNKLGYTILSKNTLTNSPGESLGFIIYTVLLAPLIEELIYRKFLIDHLSKHGKHFAIMISAVLFALAHGNIPQFITAFPLGLILGYAYCLSKSVKLVIILHIINNIYVNIYNELILKYIDIHNYLQIFVIAELIIVIILMIWAVLFYIKDENLRLVETEVKSNSKYLFKQYFCRITTIFIVIAYIIEIVVSVERLGG